MRKVLIVTYYWPPSGGSGVQRWLKFAKYLPQYGWQPVIYTPENPDFAIEDSSLMHDIAPDTEVLKTRIWEPYELYKALTGNKGKKVNVAYAARGKKSGWVHKMALALRGNLLIPDPRCFWINPSVKYLTSYLKEHPVDAIITTGPPHSMHMIGRKLHRITNIPWIADFRDPWTNIDFYKELNLSWVANKIHHRKEQQVISEADCVVSVTPTWCAEFEMKHPKKIALVHNGYDEADVAGHDVVVDQKFSLVHIGSINAARNPVVLWRALSELVVENKQLAAAINVQLIGNIEDTVLEAIENYNLKEFVETVGYLSHKDAVAFQQRAQLLLLLVNNTPNANGILTGKLYEYMASGRPTLAIGPTGSDIAKVLLETEAGTIVGFDDVEGMKQELILLFDKYQKGTLRSLATGYEKYSRRAQCGVMADLLNDISCPLNPPQGDL